jgi:hypothetical protein
MSITGSHRLEPHGPGTAHTVSLELTGPLASTLASTLRRPIASVITRENTGFKSAAEAN